MKKIIALSIVLAFAVLPAFSKDAPAAETKPASEAKGDNKGGSAESKKHRKDGEQQRIESARRSRRSDDFIHRLDRGGGLVFINRLNLVANGGG